MYIHIYIYVCSFYIPNHGSLQTFLKVKIDGKCKCQKVGTGKGSKIQPICRRLCRHITSTSISPWEGATHCLPCPAGQEVGELNPPVFWGGGY